MRYIFDNHRPQTPRQKKDGIMRELYRNYGNDPEARKFLVRVEKKQRAIAR